MLTSIFSLGWHKVGFRRSSSITQASKSIAVTGKSQKEGKYRTDVLVVAFISTYVVQFSCYYLLRIVVMYMKLLFY